jgi:hypothetical protein
MVPKGRYYYRAERVKSLRSVCLFKPLYLSYLALGAKLELCLPEVAEDRILIDSRVFDR